MHKFYRDQLILLVIAGCLYSAIHLYFDLDIMSMTVGMFFGILYDLIWNLVFLEGPKFKNKYKQNGSF